jgi:hypothetical protein
MMENPFLATLSFLEWDEKEKPIVIVAMLPRTLFFKRNYELPVNLKKSKITDQNKLRTRPAHAQNTTKTRPETRSQNNTQRPKY